jgi:hypothetical protein
MCRQCYEGEVEALFGNNHGEKCPCQACVFFFFKNKRDHEFIDFVYANFEQRILDVLFQLRNPPKQHPGQLTIHDFLEP